MTSVTLANISGAELLVVKNEFRKIIELLPFQSDLYQWAKTEEATSGNFGRASQLDTKNCYIIDCLLQQNAYKV